MNLIKNLTRKTKPRNQGGFYHYGDKPTTGIPRFKSKLDAPSVSPTQMFNK